MTELDVLAAIERQLRIANALALVRIAGDNAWTDAMTTTVGERLHIQLADIFPPTEEGGAS